MKRKNLFMSLTIMFGLLAMAFNFEIDKISWQWNNNKILGIISVILAIAFGVQWIIQQKRLKNSKQN